ncbi:MAG: ATP-binding protein [Streptosporangiaceae bacterium]|nr:ATP-binding protein [Streptosporangiaceae bacterium]
MTGQQGPPRRTTRAGDDSGVTRSQHIIVVLVVLSRLAALAQVAGAVIAARDRYPHLVPVILLAAAVWAESLTLLLTAWRAGRFRPAWVSADVVFNVAGLIAGAELTGTADFASWANFMYPYTVIASIAAGAVLIRLTAVLATALTLAGSYILAAVAVGGGPAWNILPNSSSYLGTILIIWTIAGQFRRFGRDLDRSREEAVAQAVDLDRQREHARQARLLHDRVLQTMETLARDQWIPDTRLRQHVAREATWLRRFVEGQQPDRSSDLASALRAVVDTHRALGLQVELNTAQLDQARPGLPDVLLDALAGAVDEALTNVAKHAGVNAATVHASASGRGIQVSVVDHGRGFTPGLADRLGIRESIKARMTVAGGRAAIESTPGTGTCIELWGPLTQGT